MRPPTVHVLRRLVGDPVRRAARNRLQQRQRTDRRASDGRPRHALQGQRRRRRRHGRRRVPDGIRARRRGRARARRRRADQRLRRDAVQRRGRRRRLQVPREVDRDGDPRQEQRQLRRDADEARRHDAARPAPASAPRSSSPTLTPPRRRLPRPNQRAASTASGRSSSTRAGDWTVRFHFYENCNDAPEDSPHGHAAFFVHVP